MRNVATLTKRELAATFLSPMAYVVLTAFILLSGYLFFELVSVSRRAEMSGIISFMAWLLLFVSPMLTMRLFADEFDSGTIETLLTAPVTTLEVVLSKYLASLLFLLVLLAATMAYPAILFAFGRPDPGPIVAGYLGLFLVGGFLLAVGMVASACARTQISAAIITFIVVLSMDILRFLVPASAVDPLSKGLRYVSFSTHFFDVFTKGIIDSRDVVYFLSTSAFCIFLTTVIVTVRRWR